MKRVHEYQEDDNNLTPPSRKNTRRPSAQVKHALPPRRDAQLTASDVEVVRRSMESIKARNERIEMLKAQVNAGTYKVDSKVLAQKMVAAPGMLKLLGVGRYSLLDYGDEE